MPPAISISGVTKRYGSVLAVGAVDLEIESGQVYALLGPNGAGKTTLIEILEGYRQRDAGDVSVLGYDPQRQRGELNRRVGIVLQRSTPMEGLTPREMLNFSARLYDDPMSTDDALDLVGLTEHADRRGSKLSGGQKRRLDLATSVIGNPDLIFLDEPTTGFDATARRQAWEVVRGLTDRGATIILTTHYLDEAEHLAQRIGLIKDGRIIFEGDIAGLRREMETDTRISWQPPIGFDRAEMLTEWSDLPQGADGRLSLPTQTPTVHLARLIDWAQNRGLEEIPELQVERPDLEEMYLELVDDSQSLEQADGS
ncbi:MAG: ABC transporter ATP-binding protein [Chloroflexota bacterium]|nr:ABC transporter ATP-binding protein [Chloroflexota bacterium]MDE2894868.1 ABC transporter ATP-binding protein [Chloroflexota bacterium]